MTIITLTESVCQASKLNKRQLAEFAGSGISPEYASLNFRNAPKKVVKRLLNPLDIPAKNFTFESNEYKGGWVDVHESCFKPVAPSPGLKYYTLKSGINLYEVLHPISTQLNTDYIYICEGAKKAVAVAEHYKCRTFYYLSLGHGDTVETRSMIQDLAGFNAKIRICLDNDFKAATLRKVKLMLRDLGSALGHNFEVSHFLGKGIDDAIVMGHPITWVDSRTWNPQDSTVWDITENSRYLSPIEFPNATRLCVIRSAKGTGKSFQLANLAQKAKSEQRPIIVITHRINLSRALAREFDIPYIDDANYQEGGSVALCINSIQKIKLTNLEGAYIFIDECDQVLDDLMRSDTMTRKRVKILDTVRLLGQVICERAKGTFFIASADVEKRHITAYQKLLSVPECSTFGIHNTYVIPKGNCFFYSYLYPDVGVTEFMLKLKELLDQNLKLYISLSAQKVESNVSTQNVETYINTYYPDLDVIRIDSQSTCDPVHPAYRAPGKIKQLCQEYDVVIASPTLGTGVDIRFDYHVFDAVLGFSNGITTDTDSTRQAMARVRDVQIPRYVFAPKFVDSSCIDWRYTITTKQEFFKVKQEELVKVAKYNQDFYNQWVGELGIVYDSDAMEYWLSSNQRSLTELNNFGWILKSKLTSEGFNVVDDKVDSLEDGVITPANQLLDIRIESTEQEREAIANCAEITEECYSNLCKKDQHTHAEQILIRSYKLRSKWGLHPSVEVQQSVQNLELYKRVILATDLFEVTKACLETYNFDLNKNKRVASDDILNSQYYATIVDISEKRKQWLGQELTLEIQKELTGHNSKEIEVKKCNSKLLGYGLKAKRVKRSGQHIYLIESLAWEFDLGAGNEGISLTSHLPKHLDHYYSSRLAAWTQAKRDLQLITDAEKMDRSDQVDPRALSNKYTALSTRAKCLSKLPEPPKPTFALDNPKGFLQALSDASTLTVDIETYAGTPKNYGDTYDYSDPAELVSNSDDKKGGLNPIDGRIRLIQVYDGDTIWVVEASDLYKHFKTDFAKMFCNPKQLKVLHNSQFDLRFLRWQGFIGPVSNVADTMIGSRCLFGDMGAAKVTSHSLKQLAKHLFNVDIDKDQQTSDWGVPELTKEQIDYAALDVFYTYHCYERLVDVCKDPSILGLPFPKDSALKHWETRNKTIPGYLEMQSNGYIVNSNKDKLIKERKQALADCMLRWSQLCPDFEPTKNAKLMAHIFEKYGITLPSLSSQDIVGEYQKPELILRQQIIALKADLRILENTVEVGQRQPLTIGMVSGTGRCNSGMSKVSKRFFNFHSIPKSANKALKEYNLTSLRTMFSTDCIIDLPASHGRISAELANDKYALDRYIDPKLDMHCDTASILAKICFSKTKAQQFTPKYIKENKDKIKECKQLRSAAKNTYYGWLNGAGAATIKKQIQANIGLEVSKSDCQEALNAMQDNFKATVTYAQERLSKLLDPAYQFIIDGKVFGYMDINGFYLSWFLGNVGQSLSVPATKAFACIWSLTENLIMNRALADIQQAFTDNPGWGAKLQNFIHDEFNITYNDPIAASVAYDIVKSHFGQVCPSTVEGFDSLEKCIEGIETCADK